MRHWPAIVTSLVLVSACSVQTTSQIPAPQTSTSPVATTIPGGGGGDLPSPSASPSPLPSPSPSLSPSPTPTPSQLSSVPEADHGSSPFPTPPAATSAPYDLSTAVLDSGTSSGYITARGAVDGNVYTEWAPRQGVQPSTWLSIDLGTSKQLSRVDLLPDAKPDVLCYFNVEVSTDGTKWTTAGTDGRGTGSNTVPAWGSLKFTTTTARFVRIRPTDWGMRSWVGVWEIKLYP